MSFWRTSALSVAFALSSIAALAQSGSAGGNSQAAQPATIKVAYFTQQPVIEMAQRHGFFAAENLTVVEQKTSGSTVLFKNLRDGVWDVGFNVGDNDLQFRLNPGNPLHMTFPAVIFAGIDNGAGASLMARPEIKTCADARGKTFAVDAPASGYAYIGYQILHNKCHFEPNVDYRVGTTGGTDRRYADLVAGKADSQMVVIHTGLPEGAEAKGMTRLGTMLPDAVSAYTGVVATATRSWLDSHGDEAVRFIRALKRATDYVVDPAHKAEILAVLPSDGDQAVAERIYQVVVNETKGGLIRDLHVDPNGLRATAQLRETWHGWETPVDVSWIASPESGVYDMSYWTRAQQ